MLKNEASDVEKNFLKKEINGFDDGFLVGDRERWGRYLEADRNKRFWGTSRMMYTTFKGAVYIYMVNI